jgi:hypothetical protein
MRIKSVLVPLFIGAIFLSACNRSFVTLDYTNAKGEVPQLGNLTFRFSKSLISDSLLNNWDSTEYISFEPKIPGRFRWESPDELVFSPSKPLAPSTTYKAKIHNDVLRNSKYDKVKTEAGVEFHTAPLQLTNAQVTWVLADEGSKVAVPQVHLAFNYPVKPDAIRDKLALEVEGVKTSYTVQTPSTAGSIVIRLNGFKANDQNYDAKLILDKGLTPEGGSNSTGEKIETQLSIPSPYVLNINEVQSEHDGTEGIVRISTSQQLTGENITSLIKFEPAVPYKIEYTEFGATIYSAKFSAENGYALTIVKGLRGKIGGVLKEEYSGSVAFGQLESGVKFTNGKGIYLSKRGGGNIEVSITNTPKVKLIISKIYESNLLMAQRYGYSPKDDRSEEAGYVSYEEEGDNGYSEALAGDVVYTKEIDTRSLPKSVAAVY